MKARVSPQRLVLGIGVAVAIFTALSGVAAQVFDFRNENDVHRTVFANIPGAIQLAFYTLLPCLLYTSPSPRDATLSRMPSSA